MRSKTVLVVGGAGFIGSHVNKMLHQAGYQTVVLDNMNTGTQAAVTRGSFIKGDLADSACLDFIFSSYIIDAVMHFAALIDVGESVREPALYYRNNVANTLNLLEAMHRHHIPIFIFSSSAAIFGTPQAPIITEEHPCHPINPYGETKWVVEKMLRDFELAYGLKSTCLRYFNAAGGDPEGEIKNFKKKETNLIPLVLRSLITPQGCVSIYGTDYPTPDGTCIRDYIHVCDLGEAHILAMQQLFEGAPSDFYNLGNGQGFSVRQVIQKAEQVTGLKVQVIEADRRPGDPPILVADAQKAAHQLGWRPHYPELETMIKHAWQALN
ncbi:UDP-glucose 4-epimerase GalE [Parachlamydia sp. AcF125]|uniref:UDP-glucose 4-epimerase GalE n=1 Tax=Parachlamydia sp. AcF125 TaxID=2795736 RepID=UPI001BC9A681|nr:UDP-glucose 4-epimerase GalE [Parachlamydia sp. AcF125]MBS4167521.1 UDP-glucose 4-epimerase [Parachlamydia sp. AcF125]